MNGARMHDTIIRIGFDDGDLGGAGQASRWDATTRTAPLRAPTATPSPRYVLREVIGRGGIGIVYRAEDRALDREVALKLLAEPMRSERVMRVQFVQEAQAAAGLRHPNIVLVYDLGELERQPFICMELLRGLTLETLLSRVGALSCMYALEIIAQVLAALRFAHGHGVIHRDVKPGNIMLTRAGEVKLMDFGLAQCARWGRTDELIAGTPRYMAPEQIAGLAVDARADVFSAGVCLYQMLAGESPFSGMDRSAAAPPIRARNPTVPAALDMLIQSALRIDRERRFPTSGAMLAAVQRLLSAASQYEQRHRVVRPTLGSLVRRLELGTGEHSTGPCAL